MILVTCLSLRFCDLAVSGFDIMSLIVPDDFPLIIVTLLPQLYFTIITSNASYPSLIYYNYIVFSGGRGGGESYHSFLYFSY